MRLGFFKRLVSALFSVSGIRRRGMCGMQGPLLASLVAVLVLHPADAPAQSCQVPSPLLSLGRTLAAVAAAPSGTITKDQASRISSQISQMSERRILSELKENGLDSLLGLSLDILAEGERLSTAGAYYEGYRLRDMLSEFDETSMLSCSTTDGGFFQEAQQERAGGLFSDSGVSWEEFERQLKENRVVSGATLVTAMAAFIGIMFAMDSGMRLAMALIYNRKACRVPAGLEVNGNRVEGLIVTLGRGGLRFHPLDMMRFDAVIPLLRSFEVNIEVEDLDPIPCRMSTVRETVADFRMEEHITIREQNAILTHSTISPYYIRRSRGGGEEHSKKIAAEGAEGPTTEPEVRPKPITLPRS